MSDKQFMTFFLGIMGILLIIFFIIFIVAKIIVPEQKVDKFTRDAIVSRIEPVGKLNYSDEASEEPASEGTLIKADFKNGKEVYTAACQGCHNSGVLNSPKYGDVAAWKNRLSKGKEKLYSNAINGINSMPAKGGRSDLSDDMVKMGVDYILQAAN